MRDLIFISYRRSDSMATVNALAERLSKMFGVDAVFHDVQSITPGEQFPDRIRRALERAAVVLVVIGNTWFKTVDKFSTRRRIDDPDDWVRLEIETALENPRTLVIPVLINGASLPTQSDDGAFPPSLKDLSTAHAVELDDARWDASILPLIDKIKSRLDTRVPDRRPTVLLLYPDTANKTVRSSGESDQGWHERTARLVTLCDDLASALSANGLTVRVAHGGPGAQLDSLTCAAAVVVVDPASASAADFTRTCSIVAWRRGFGLPVITVLAPGLRPTLLRQSVLSPLRHSVVVTAHEQARNDVAKRVADWVDSELAAAEHPEPVDPATQWLGSVADDVLIEVPEHLLDVLATEVGLPAGSVPSGQDRRRVLAALLFSADLNSVIRFLRQAASALEEREAPGGGAGCSRRSVFRSG